MKLQALFSLGLLTAAYASVIKARDDPKDLLKYDCTDDKKGHMPGKRLVIPVGEFS
jgi:hypothetical protein